MTVLSARAVLLDMDGTLVDSTAAVERIWLSWAEGHGLDPATVLEVVHGRQGHESMAILLPHRSTAENLADNVRHLREETSDLDGVVAIPGARELLAALDGQPHALVTSADVALMEARMGAAGLSVPALAVTAERVSASKPHPEGFLLAARLLGVDPVDCVVFEDSGAGIEAGKAAGMRVVGVGEAAIAHGPDHVVADLTGVAIARVESGLTIALG
ncbi:MAG: HAD-IA family hydrolase [Microbacterium sp.]